MKILIVPSGYGADLTEAHWDNDLIMVLGDDHVPRVITAKGELPEVTVLSRPPVWQRLLGRGR